VPDRGLVAGGGGFGAAGEFGCVLGLLGLKGGAGSRVHFGRRTL
jgi:hypothetical protein